MTKQTFNHIARWYDIVAQVVFFGAIKKSQINNLQSLDTAKSVLVIGGGTGWIINEIWQQNPNIYITYIDQSSKMIQMAQRRSLEGDVIFHNKDYLDTVTDQTYDTIICNFFLDVFTEKDLETVVQKMKRQLNPDGKILFTDFVAGKNHHLIKRSLIKTMYWFFKCTNALSNTTLPNYHTAFLRANLDYTDEKKYYYNMISSRVYKSNGTNRIIY
jgi:ubiquinone/menaquinone biosynthesis C-methylase UbiE